jgi:hypothetical protein
MLMLCSGRVTPGFWVVQGICVRFVLCTHRQCEENSQGEPGAGSDKKQNCVRHDDRRKEQVRCYRLTVLDHNDHYQDRQDCSGNDFHVAHKVKERSARLFSLSKTPASERGDSWPLRNIWINDQLKHPNAIEIYFVILDLASRPAGTEIPLLLKQGPQRVGLVL